MTLRKPKLLQPDQLLNLALRTLGGRAYSTGELREKLRKRAARAEDVDAVLAKLRQNGYLDDRRFAEHYAAARLEAVIDVNNGQPRILHMRDLTEQGRGYDLSGTTPSK